MKKENRLCVYCEYLDFEDMQMGSTWTGAYGRDGFICKKGHINAWYEADIEELRKGDLQQNTHDLFKRAIHCPDYFQPLDINEKVKETIKHIDDEWWVLDDDYIKWFDSLKVEAER